MLRAIDKMTTPLLAPGFSGALKDYDADVRVYMFTLRQMGSVDDYSRVVALRRHYRCLLFIVIRALDAPAIMPFRCFDTPMIIDAAMS